MMENGEAVAKETLRTVNAGAKADKVAEMEGADDPPPPPSVRLRARAFGIIHGVFLVRVYRACTRYCTPYVLMRCMRTLLAPVARTRRVPAYWVRNDCTG